jgi:hypothetical protein
MAYAIRAGDYPRELMQDVAWSFTGPTFSSQAEFEYAVRQYQAEIFGEQTWQAEEVVLQSPRVRVENEYEEEPEEAVAELIADNPGGFTAGELLFKVHNAFVGQLRDGDHHFFEGFSLAEEQVANRPPLYEIDLGS